MAVNKFIGVAIDDTSNIMGVNGCRAVLGQTTTSGGFTPPSNTVAWFKADELVGFVDNDPVGTWPDDSGAGNDVTGSGAVRPLYKTAIQNGLPIVRFDGTDDYLELAGSPTLGAQTYTVHMVAINRNTTSSLFTSVGGNQWRCGRWGSDGKSAMSANSLLQGTSGDISVNTAHQLTYVFAGASSKVYVNGVERASGNAGTRSLDRLYLARYFDGASFSVAQVDLGEVLIRIGVRDTATEAYLKAKWATP
jgi:hypothetical protein